MTPAAVFSRRFLYVLPLLAVSLGMTAAAQNDDAAPTPAQEQAAREWKTAMGAMVSGPQSVGLIEQGRLALPEGFGFVPTPQATTLMQLMGNRVDDRFIGLVFPLAEEASYFVSLDYEDSGYIEDDEAADWDADGLLKSLKDGTEAGNAERRRGGFDALTVTRWVEPPSYDGSAHRLVWSAEAVVKDRVDSDPTINYNTYVLGREGYFSANLITTASTVADDRRTATPLLQAVSFNDGKRYQDFNSSTDKVAAYGLTALVAGVAAKKLGLIAVAAAFFAKFAKLILVGAAGLAGGARAFFRKKST